MYGVGFDCGGYVWRKGLLGGWWGVGVGVVVGCKWFV